MVKGYKVRRSLTVKGKKKKRNEEIERERKRQQDQESLHMHTYTHECAACTPQLPQHPGGLLPPS